MLPRFQRALFVTLLSLLTISSCKTPNETARSMIQQTTDNGIKLVQIEPGETGYSPDAGLHYVWDNGSGSYHVEINEMGSEGFYWIDNQKFEFESGCNRGTSDIGCSGSSWIFYAPMRLDASHHIYGNAQLVKTPSTTADTVKKPDTKP